MPGALQGLRWRIIATTERLDALVWGLTELLVEPMPHWGIFEYTRQRAEAIRGQNPSPPEPVYAIGSLEWQRQQEQAKGDRW
jgi:hypothetical protein